MTGGSPMATVDPAALNGVQWAVNVPTDGVSLACQASFTISNLTFINDGVGKTVDFTFDTSAQGWALNTFADPNATNLGAGVPDGGTPPTLVFQANEGDPSSGAGSLKVAMHFSALDQYVDAIFNPTAPLNLSGQTLHAMVRLVSGALPIGGVLIHAGTGPTFVFGAGTFLTPLNLPQGAWTPLTLNLGAVTQTGFDPSAVVQFGIQFLSGRSASGDVFQGPTDPVFEIDTFTN
jgi:hypothetical protein